MKIKHLKLSILIATTALSSLLMTTQTQAAEIDGETNCRIIAAARIFNGVKLHENKAILIKGRKIKQVAPLADLEGACDHLTDLGNATILPGFIETHAHISFQKVPADIVLKHGITTVRDTGGPLLAPRGGRGDIRLVSSSPILTAPNGYPLNLFSSGGHHGGDVETHTGDETAHTGHGAVHTGDETTHTGDETTHTGEHNAHIIGVGVETAAEARAKVREFIEGGAAFIKVALEPGGEHGAPWASHGHNADATTEAWPMLSLKIVKAIVDEAHSLDTRVIAHIGENTGANIAVKAGIDEWSHIPCAEIDDDLLGQAVAQGVKFVTTLDTLGACQGNKANMHKLAGLNAKFLYGSEIGHNDVPWGINAEELQQIVQITGMPTLKVLKMATSKAGKYLKVPLLGRLVEGAPADVIAVRGNPLERLKLLEYPDLVISGGVTVVDNFHHH